MTIVSTALPRSSMDRVFFAGMTLLILFAMFYGFARTWFLRPLFPEVPAPTETFFIFHGITFTAWFVLLTAQAGLVWAGRIDLHRRFGYFGAGLATLMVVLGIHGALVAARRPEGFIGVPVPAPTFLIEPLCAILLFTLFVSLAIYLRRDSETHKRLILIGSISILAAALARWPIGLTAMTSPVPGIQVPDLVLDLFLLPLIAWDLTTRGRLHPATLWGGLLLVATQPLKWMLAGTASWQGFAGWLIG